MKLGKYSFGIGDRFAKQGEHQLAAFERIAADGIDVTPVWNKSFREHQTVGSVPKSVRQEADESTANRNWSGNYLVDADHINLENVDDFIPYSDFFTIDVAKFIDQPTADQEIKAFLDFLNPHLKDLKIEGITEDLSFTEAELSAMSQHFLKATHEAGAIYRHILKHKEGDIFFTEVSIDEVENPQTPKELFFILAALAYHKVPVDTIAPKFTGRFNKGVDYEGDLKQFEKEFDQDLSVITHCVKVFGFDANLKLSVHTGSDKFSLYPIIGKLIRKHNAGLHLKTAGTTWLEELIGLAESDGDALALAKEIYKTALNRYDELTGPYSTVINIDKAELPGEADISDWSATQFTDALRHDQQNKNYNPHMRQLLHTAYKVAAEKDKHFTEQLEENDEVIGRNVTDNIYKRHLKPLFS